MGLLVCAIDIDEDKLAHATRLGYLPGQRASFVAGKTPPDFPADNFKVDFVGRDTEAGLTALGKSHLGLS
jgi:hypothetical protein